MTTQAYIRFSRWSYRNEPCPWHNLSEDGSRTLCGVLVDVWNRRQCSYRASLPKETRCRTCRRLEKGKAVGGEVLEAGMQAQ